MFRQTNKKIPQFGYSIGYTTIRYQKDWIYVTNKMNAFFCFGKSIGNNIEILTMENFEGRVDIDQKSRITSSSRTFLGMKPCVSGFSHLDGQNDRIIFK